MASKCISNLAQSQPPSTSSRSDGGCTEIQGQRRWIEWQGVYSADHKVDRHHLISISYYHTMKIHTLSFPTFGLPRAVWDVVDPQHRVVSYLLTRFLHILNQNRSFWWILSGCCERWGWVLMVGSLSSSSIVLLQWPPSSVSLSFLNWCVQVLFRFCSTNICGQIDGMFIFTETSIMHAILWCSESCDCNKDEYDRTKCLVVV